MPWSGFTSDHSPKGAKINNLTKKQNKSSETTYESSFLHCCRDRCQHRSAYFCSAVSPQLPHITTRFTLYITIAKFLSPVYDPSITPMSRHPTTTFTYRLTRQLLLPRLWEPRLSLLFNQSCNLLSPNRSELRSRWMETAPESKSADLTLEPCRASQQRCKKEPRVWRKAVH